MKQVLRFPNGGACRPYVITRVSIEDSGVGAYNNNDVQVGWIDGAHPIVMRRIAQVLNDCIDAGKNFVQPDWAALIAQFYAELEATEA